jgi:hypothetical protein
MASRLIWTLSSVDCSESGGPIRRTKHRRSTIGEIDEVDFKLYDEDLASSIAYVLAVSHDEKNTLSAGPEEEPTAALHHAPRRAVGLKRIRQDTPDLAQTTAPPATRSLPSAANLPSRILQRPAQEGQPPRTRGAAVSPAHLGDAGVAVECSPSSEPRPRSPISTPKTLSSSTAFPRERICEES